MCTSETLRWISKVSLEESKILVVCVDEAEYRLGGSKLSTELGDVDIDTGLVDAEPAFLGIEFEESPLTTRGSNRKVRVDRSTDTNGTSLFHVEGEANERSILLHFPPGCGANLRIMVPEPEVVVDPIYVEAGCSLIHREVDTKEDGFPTEDLIGIKDVSDVEYGR